MNLSGAEVGPAIIVALVNGVVLLLIARGLRAIDRIAHEVGEIEKDIAFKGSEIQGLRRDIERHYADDRTEFGDVWDAINRRHPEWKP